MNRGLSGALQTRNGWLQSALGEHCVLARRGDSRLHLMNASAAWLWDRQHAGPDEPGAELARLTQVLTTEQGLPPAMAKRQAGAVLSAWRQAGLLTAKPPPESAWVIPPPAPRPPVAGERLLAVAGQVFGLVIESAALAAALGKPLRRLQVASPRPRTQALRLHGEPANWTLSHDGQIVATGATPDSAVVSVLASLIDLACRAEGRLLVIHGAGLAHPDGGGVCWWRRAVPAKRRWPPR